MEKNIVHAYTMADFDPYQWKKKLGSGSQGSVYMAFDKVLGRRVVAKVSHGEEGQKEFEALAKLDHPNIVRVLFSTLINEPPNTAVFLEWVPGGSVEDLLEGTDGLQEGVIRRYIYDALTGLEYLHGRKVLHRDIKPGNMLVDQDGKVKLSDFGTCKDKGTGQTTVNVVGSPAFMAPETIGGKYSEGSDLYALGCTGAQMASGKLPWSEMNFSSIQDLQMHISHLPPNHHPKIADHISAELRAILTKMLAVDPEARGSAAQLLQDPYFDVVRIKGAPAAAPTAGGGTAAAGGTFPKWMRDLPVNDDVKAIFVMQDIDEETFEGLEEKHLEKLGLAMGPCQRLLKEIANRKQGGAKGQKEDDESKNTEPAVKTPLVLQSPPPSNKEEPPTKKKTPLGLADMLRASFFNPPKDWVDSNPVSTWSGITVNGAGEVIEIDRSIIVEHPVADWSKFPSTLQKLNVNGTNCKVNDDAIKLIATQCTGLQVLSVYNTAGAVTDDAIKLIATQCTGLRYLDVSSTGGKVTDDAIKLIARQCTGLQVLNVHSTGGKVTDDAIKLIATQCTGLQVLNVRSTGGKVTDDAIKLIATQCTGLQVLNVQYTSGKVTDASLKLLGAQCTVYKQQ